MVDMIRHRRVLLNQGGSDEGGGGGEESLLLDTYTGAAAAYSLRKLRTDYSGSAIRVRESGGDTEADIGFDGNDLDETVLLNHCGANDGFVVTWYDQSGNSRDATNATAAKQPQIVSAGTVTKEGGKAAVDFDGVAHHLELGGTALPLSGTQQSALFSVCVADSTAADRKMFTMKENTTGAAAGSEYGFTAEYGIRVDGGNEIYSESAVNQNVASIHFPAGSSEVADFRLWKNDTESSVASSSAQAISFSNEIAGIGRRMNWGDYFDGRIQELILWADDQLADRTDITSNINTYYSIF